MAAKIRSSACGEGRDESDGKVPADLANGLVPSKSSDDIGRPWGLPLPLLDKSTTDSRRSTSPRRSVVDSASRTSLLGAGLDLPPDLRLQARRLLLVHALERGSIGMGGELELFGSKGGKWRPSRPISDLGMPTPAP